MPMRRHFHQDLDELKTRLIRMGTLAKEMIPLAIKIVSDRDLGPMRRIREHEDRINESHIELDELSLRLIALHQPAARDLRLIAAALKINNDLERIGDQAVNIAETACLLARLPAMPLGDIPRMAGLAFEMIDDALGAFSTGDVELARSVILRDDEEDRMKSETFNELVSIMRSDSSKIQRAMDQILISRNLERIADHATNVAEDVIFMVKGKDIRHPGLEGAAAAAEGGAPRRVLFVCVGNSARSQMAEGFARALGGPDLDVWSAGSEPAGAVDKKAVEAMRAVGIDISGQASKGLAEVPRQLWDFIVSMGGGDDCPDFFAKERRTWDLDDPKSRPKKAYFAVRDQIERRTRDLLTEAGVRLKSPA